MVAMSSYAEGEGVGNGGGGGGEGTPNFMVRSSDPVVHMADREGAYMCVCLCVSFSVSVCILCGVCTMFRLAIESLSYSLCVCMCSDMVLKSKSIFCGVCAFLCTYRLASDLTILCPTIIFHYPTDHILLSMCNVIEQCDPATCTVYIHDSKLL